MNLISLSIFLELHTITKHIQASEIFTWSHDTVRPEIQIVSNQGESNFSSNDATLNLEFLMSETVESFESHDIKVTGLALTSFEKSNSTRYIATLTPTGENVELIHFDSNIHVHCDVRGVRARDFQSHHFFFSFYLENIRYITQNHIRISRVYHKRITRTSTLLNVYESLTCAPHSNPGTKAGYIEQSAPSWRFCMDLSGLQRGGSDT